MIHVIKFEEWTELKLKEIEERIRQANKKIQDLESRLASLENKQTKVYTEILPEGW